MLYEITGKVITTPSMATGSSAKGEWKKTTVVIEYVDGQYTNKLALDNMKNADAFANLKIGDEVKIRFSVQSRENNGRWFTGANAVSWDTLNRPADAPAGGNAPF